MPVFHGAAPWHTIFTSLWVIPLWDSATAHETSSKELILSSLEEPCFSGLIIFLMFSHYPAWLSLVWYSPILLIKSICVFILSVVFFYSKRVPLSNMFHFIFGLFLWRKIAVVQSILFYVWSISIAKDRPFSEKCSLRVWWS